MVVIITIIVKIIVKIIQITLHKRGIQDILEIPEKIIMILNHRKINLKSKIIEDKIQGKEKEIEIEREEKIMLKEYLQKMISRITKVVETKETNQANNLNIIPEGREIVDIMGYLLEVHHYLEEDLFQDLVLQVPRHHIPLPNIKEIVIAIEDVILVQFLQDNLALHSTQEAARILREKVIKAKAINKKIIKVEAQAN